MNDSKKPPILSIQQPIIAYVEQAYFEYANYVIHDRALPFIGDGLKPVARRIIYAMSELSLHVGAKHKKSARTVGDVLGKFHPHGDTACYEAMVLMAQSFSYRYPFIDGQGNWGSIDEPKSFAAMRYTEARLSAYAEVLLHELGPYTVTWSENFDGSLKEPMFLPARLPNVILNGAMGIAVGIATDIAPHNIYEIVQGVLEIVRNPSCDDDTILQHILGPDLPTGGILISPRTDIISAYKTGPGNYRVRATFEKGPQSLIITSLPFQVSTAKIMRQIADLVLQKKLLFVEDIRDDSDELYPVRITLLLKNKADVDNIMHTIFAMTDCEKSYRIQQYILNNAHRPQLFTLPDLLREWLIFRKKVVVNRLESDIHALETRLHILEGLKLITLHIDEVIKIIRYEDHPDTVLMDRFALSERQVKAILDIRLKQLTKVEWLCLESEYQKKHQEKAILTQNLHSPTHFIQLLEQELVHDARIFGNPRRTSIQPQEAATRIPKASQTAPAEDIKIFLSFERWIRSSRNMSTQSDTLMYHSSDKAFLETSGRTDDILTLWNTKGHVYTLKPLDIPSVRGKGEPLSQWIDSPQPLSHMLIGKEDTFLCAVSSDGYGFKTTMGYAHTRLKNGKSVVQIPENQHLLAVLPLTPYSTYMALFSQQGRILITPLDPIPILKKGRGVKIMGLLKKDLLQGQDTIVHVCLLEQKSTLILSKNDQKWQQTPEQWHKLIAKRGQRGHTIPRNFRSGITAMHALAAPLA